MKFLTPVEQRLTFLLKGENQIIYAQVTKQLMRVKSVVREKIDVKQMFWLIKKKNGNSTLR